MDVEEHRARSVARIGHVRAATGQVVNEPRINRAEGELASFCFGFRAFHIFQNPLQLGGGEIGVDHQASLLADSVGETPLLQAIASRRGAPILPDNRIVDGPTTLLVPNECRLTLVGDADGADIRAGGAGLMNGLRGYTRLRGPDFVRVVFHPSRLRENLAKFLLGARDDRARVIKENGAGTGGSLVESENILHSIRR